MLKNKESLKTRRGGIFVNKLLTIPQLVLKLVILPMILLTMFSCTKLPANSTDDGSNEGGGVPAPEATWNVEGMTDITDIKEDAYTAVGHQTPYSSGMGVGYQNSGTGYYYVRLLEGGFGLKWSSSSSNVRASRNNVKFQFAFNYDPDLLKELYVDENTKFSFYVTDANGKIILEPNKTLTFSDVTARLAGSEWDKVPSLLEVISPFTSLEEYENKEINFIVAYESTNNGEKYYIKYPALTFTYKE